MKAMKPKLGSALLAGIALTLASATFASPQTDAAMTAANYQALAGKVNAAGHRQAALFFLEEALVESIGQPGVFGPLAGRYWQATRKAEAWSRAYRFFSLLKARHPDDANVLANYGNAIGSVLGMLSTQGYRTQMGANYFPAMTAKAMQAYDTALSTQPDNFSALLGRAIFQAYMPGKLDKAESEFRHILTLRQAHPYYPYALVYRQWAMALKRHGQPEKAEKILQQGKAELGAAAFSHNAHAGH